MKRTVKKDSDRRFSIPLWIPALCSAIAAGASAFAAFKTADIAEQSYDIAQKSHDIAKQKLEDFRTRIRFDFDLIGANDWSVHVSQVSGEAYHIPIIKITPSLYDERRKVVPGMLITKSPEPVGEHPLPSYQLDDLESEICRTQTIQPCEIATLYFEFYVHGDARDARLP